MSDEQRIHYQYDVAFSLLDQDKGTAAQVSGLFSGVNLFFYPESEAEIRFTDGVETFTNAFAIDARIVTVFYRDGWGSTKWTRLEEGAIRGRCWEEGHDFITMIRMDSSPVPKWFQQHRIWVGLERLGIQGLASALIERMNQRGGATREATASAADRALAEIDQIALKIGNWSRVEGANSVVVKAGRYRLCVVWDSWTGDGPRLRVYIQQEQTVSPEDGTVSEAGLEEYSFSFDRSSDGTTFWRSGEVRTSADRFADWAMKSLLRLVQRASPDGND